MLQMRPFLAILGLPHGAPTSSCPETGELLGGCVMVEPDYIGTVEAVGIASFWIGVSFLTSQNSKKTIQIISFDDWNHSK
jgi:hypothetical protein